MTLKRLPSLLVGLVVLSALAGVLYPKGSTLGTSRTESTMVGTDLGAVPAPSFRLRDQFGRRVSLASLHGSPVIVTFMGATCTTLCPVVAETIRRTVAELGPERTKLAVVAISTDPEHDTPAAVKRFSLQHRLMHRWHYLVADRATLTPIWRAYHLYVAPKNAPPQIADAHTSATYLIDADGRERVLMTNSPDVIGLDRDVRILMGLQGVSMAQVAIPAPQAGHPAPALSLPGLRGGTVSLNSLRGKVVVLNFWATWCTPCKSEMPLLQRWYHSVKGKGVVVLGVDQQEGRKDVEPFVRKVHVDYPIALDTDGVASAQFDVAGLPTTLVIDRQGIVRSFKPGILDEPYLDSQLRSIVDGHATS
jgi:cytochrome oxidase Cu insertion factor (SCO1/SenC/PrrC family)/thiol-disulfide isomerase/thioredoxin